MKKNKWILYFSKKGRKLDKIIPLSEKQERLWKKYGYLIEYEDDNSCEDYLDYKGTLEEAKSFADSLITLAEAIKICEEYGWEISKGKWHLENPDSEDKVNFQTDEELIAYAKELEKSR